MARITTIALRARWRGYDRWLSDGGSRGAGRLLARLMRDGVQLYYQHYHQGEKRRLPLGPYDEAGSRGLSLVQARDRIAQLSALYRAGTTDLHAHFAREREAQERAAREAEEAVQREKEAARRSTLRQLVDAYVKHLERQRKPSAREARNLIDKHVFQLQEAPQLADRKAADLMVDDFVAVIGRPVEAGKGRTAAKLRSYLRAAYALAIRSRTDPEAPLAMRAFGVKSNPLADIGAMARFSRARDRVLSGPELASYLQRLEALPVGPVRDALLLQLYLGGQRPAQLLRVRPADVDLSAATVTLYDPKGARQHPRRHVLPLVKEASEILARRLATLEDGDPLFLSVTAPVRPEILSAAATEISTAMVAAKEAREAFQLRDVRRTAETLLAGLGVSSDVRAQLQSHGLGGVQARHYDHHKYALEKRQALEQWARHLRQLKTGETAKVVPMRGKRRKPGATP